ncbi:unnamed protein product [Effrenium voratum]|nr:unnamed protein product [Effrenium voratum]
MSQALMPDMMIESRRQVKKRTNATAGRGALVVNSQELAHADFDTRSQGTALLQSAYSTQPLMAAWRRTGWAWPFMVLVRWFCQRIDEAKEALSCLQRLLGIPARVGGERNLIRPAKVLATAFGRKAAQFDPMAGVQMPPQQPQMPLGVMPSAKALRWTLMCIRNDYKLQMTKSTRCASRREEPKRQFLQPTSLQVPSMSAMQMQPDLTPSDGNLRGMAMPQIPALAPMYQPYQPYQPSWLYPSWQMQPQNFYRQDLVLQEQLSSMNKELQSLKQQEQKEAKDLELKATEVGVAEKHLREAEQKMKDADVAAKQLQDREQNVEDQAISAVRTAKTQVAQAQKEVKDMQDELRQAQADAIQARAAQAAAEEQVAKSEMLQAAQASDKQLGWMSQ